MNNEIKEILDNFEKYEARYKLHNETQFIITHREIQPLLDYITNLQQENERLKELSFIQRKEYEKLFNHLIIDKPRERNKKAINIYNNRNSLKYKKQRFMQGKTTADLMYEALQNGSDDNE